MKVLNSSRKNVSFRLLKLKQVTILVNGKESKEVAMILGPAGEAFFVGEEVPVDDL